MLKVNKPTQILKNRVCNPDILNHKFTPSMLLYLMKMCINNKYITEEIFDELKKFPFLVHEKKYGIELLYYKMDAKEGINIIKYNCNEQTKISGTISKIGIGSIHQYNYNQYICVTKINVDSEKSQYIYNQKYQLVSCICKDLNWGGNSIIKEANPTIGEIIFTDHSIYYILNNIGVLEKDFYKIKLLPNINNTIIAEIIDCVNNQKSMDCIKCPNYSICYCKYNMVDKQYEFHKIVKKNGMLTKHVILSTLNRFIWTYHYPQTGYAPLLAPMQYGDMYVCVLKSFGTTNYTFIHKIVNLFNHMVIPNKDNNIFDQYMHINNKYKFKDRELIVKQVRSKKNMTNICIEKILRKGGSYFSFRGTNMFEVYNFENNHLKIYLYCGKSGCNYGEICVDGCHHKYIDSKLITNQQCQCSKAYEYILNYENVLSYLKRKNKRIACYYDILMGRHKNDGWIYSKWEKIICIKNDSLKKNLNWVDIISQSDNGNNQFNDSQNLTEHSLLQFHQSLGIGDLIEKIYAICKQYIEHNNSKITININIKDGELTQTHIFENNGNSQPHIATLNDEVHNNKISTGWKICKTTNKQVLVKLLIPDDAIVIYAYKANKYRTNKAYVEKIYGIEKNDQSTRGTDCSKYKITGEYDQAWNHIHPTKILYEKGKTVEVSDLDDNAENSCSKGIHFCDTMEASYEWIR